MRTRGWGGVLPLDDDEAVARILAATRHTVDERGGNITITEVAQALGVTRQTIYRYFTSTEDLLVAAAAEGSVEFVDQLAEELQGLTDPTDAAVEGIALALERLPDEPYVGLLLRARPDTVASGVTSAAARASLRSLWGRLQVGWGDDGVDTTESQEFVEIMLRTVQSLILAPGDPPRTGADLRRFLRNWIGPFVQAYTGDTASTASH